MKITKAVMRAIESFIKAVSILDGFLIVALVLIIAVDIVMRIMGKSINGSVEIVAASVPIIVFLGAGYTALQEMHIRVDIVKRWPHMDRITNLLCIVFIAVIGYYCVIQAFQTKALAASSTILHIPRWPLVLTTGFGMFMVALAMVLNEVRAYINIFLNRKHRKIAPAPDIETNVD
jgi:TRAP-type C4-dicarboxylate transport system permease small subunit